MGTKVPPDLSEALRFPLPKSPGGQGGTDEYCKLEIFGETEILRELSDSSSKISWGKVVTTKYTMMLGWGLAKQMLNK